jgi:hypothetical protein
MLLIPNPVGQRAEEIRALQERLEKLGQQAEEAARQDEAGMTAEEKQELRRLTADLKRELRESRDEADAMVAADRAEKRLEQMEHRTHSVDSMAVVMYNQVVVKLQKKLESRHDTMVSAKPFAKIVKYVTDYTVNTAQEQFAAWQKLEEELLVKFMDGNVKPQNPDGSFKHSEYSTGIPEKIEWPGYTELWKETVAQEHGDIIEVKN